MRQIIVLIVTLLATGEVRADTRDARVDSLYREALANVDQVDPKTSIKAFEQALKVNWNFAAAHYEIAKLYINMDTPLTRQSARKALNEAMRFDPENSDHQITLGELLSRQGFSWHAVRHYDKLLQAEPENAEAAYWSGYYALKDYLRYRDSEIWGLDAARDLQGAKTRIRQSIDVDPGFRDAYRLLGLLNVETGRPQALITDFERLLEQAPEDKDALLFVGLGYQLLGDLDVAHTYYTRSLEQMSDEERKIMENVDLIASDEDRIRMAQAIEYGEMGTDWTHDGRDRYWRSLDPLFLTEFNERKIEHYGRFAYADLRFSRPFKEVAGWQTDPGKAFIKFGPRMHRHVTPDARGWSNHWYYEGFRISFENNDGSDNWRFARGTAPGGASARKLTELVQVVRDDGSIYKITRLRNELGDFIPAEVEERACGEHSSLPPGLYSEIRHSDISTPIAI